MKVVIVTAEVNVIVCRKVETSVKLTDEQFEQLKALLAENTRENNKAAYEMLSDAAADWSTTDEHETGDIHSCDSIEMLVIPVSE